MERTCRNCHDNGGDLISPCLCSGTMKWVHRSCLDTWRTVSPNKLSFSECDVCHFKYRVQKKPLGMWSRISYALKLTRDILFVFALALAAILIVGSISFLIERFSQYDDTFDPEVKELFQNVYFHLFCIGFLGLCFIIGFFAIFGSMCKTCLSCCEKCCSEPTYTYNTYSYNPCCDPWWCFMFYWWNAVYAPPGTWVCYPCCCCAFPAEDCCTDCNRCSCNCGGCGNCHGCNSGNCNCNCNCKCSNCNCGNCNCGNCNCGNCDCGNCDCGDCDGRVLIVILIIIVAIIILIGLFFGVAIFVVVLSRVIKNHNKVYQKQLSAREMQVVDLDKHPEYMDDESAVIDVPKSDKDGLMSYDEEEYKRKNDEYTAPEMAVYDPVSALCLGEPADDLTEVEHPLHTPSVVMQSQGTSGHTYTKCPYVDPNDHSDGYPSAVLK